MLSLFKSKLSEENISSNDDTLTTRLNLLRAGVLGANDGIVSIAAIIIGVAAVDPANKSTILLAGIAGLLAGAFSMAVGEYVSVSTQRDTEETVVQLHKSALTRTPEKELEQLAQNLREWKLSEETARQVAREISEHDPLRVHLQIEQGITADDLTSPWQAAISSFFSFLVGAVLPLATMMLAPIGLGNAFTFISVVFALSITGYVSAALGSANRSRAVIRNITGGALAMSATWLVGLLLGHIGI